MVLRAPAQYLGHVMDIPVVTQPQVPMFPKVKSTTEIPQVPIMMVHRWLPLGTGGSISQLCHNTKYQRSRRTIQRRSRLLKSSSLVVESMPRERQRQDQKTHKAVEMFRSGVLIMLWIRLSFWVTAARDSEAQKTMKIPRVQHVDKIVNFPVVSQHQSTNRPDDSHRWKFLRDSRLIDE